VFLGTAIIQIPGAVLILIAYLLAKLRVLDDRSFLYLALNLVGSAVLAALAAVEAQWGFLPLISLIAPRRVPAQRLR